MVVFGPCVEGRQTARVRKKYQKIQNIARFEISSKRRLAMRKRDEIRTRSQDPIVPQK